MKFFLLLLLSALLLSTISNAQNIGINSQGTMPHSSAMLDISSTSSGFLMPRMTTAERDAIVSPAIGLQVFNTTTGQVNTFSGSTWIEAKRTNYVLVKSLTDLPAPIGTEIALDSNTMYKINGRIDITPYHINLNGATLAGEDIARDLIMSAGPGAIIRSSNKSVYLEKIGILPISGSTSGFDLSDATGLQSCIFFPGVSVYEGAMPTQGVGKISGFDLVGLLNFFAQASVGLKLEGNMGRFLCTNPYFRGITSGSAIEFASGLNLRVADISNGQFITANVPAIYNNGATISSGRLNSNFFSGMSNPISGLTKKDPNWWMSNNNAISDSRILGQMYLSAPANNASIAANTFQVVAGTYGAESNIERMTQTNSRLTYTGSQSQVLNFVVSLSVNALSNTSGEVLEFEIRKNGASLVETRQKIAIKGATDFVNLSITGITPCNTGDYLEVWARNTTSTAAWRVEKLIFTVL